MKNLLFSIFLFIMVFFSCQQNQYHYIELISEKRIFKGYEFIEKNSYFFKAPSDSIAYLIAFERFCKTLETNRMTRRNSSDSFSTPIDFKLINEDNVNLKPSISFLEKEKTEKEIISRICPEVELPNSLSHLSSIKIEKTTPIEKIIDFGSIEIGNQVWMTKNLNITRFRNGDIIPEARSNSEWEMYGASGKPAWSRNPNNTGPNEEYGKFYNWYAVSDPRGLAPNGWKIPSESDWNILVNFLGGPQIAGKKLKGTTEWVGSGKGTNESRFNGLPGGFRDGDGHFYTDGKYYGNWWSSTERDSNTAWFRTLGFTNDEVRRNNDALKSIGFSVRCLKE